MLFWTFFCLDLVLECKQSFLFQLIMPVRLCTHCCEYTHMSSRHTHTLTHCIQLYSEVVRTGKYIYIYYLCSSCHGWLGIKIIISILVSDFSSVVSRLKPISSVDKYQHFSLDNIRVRLKWNWKQLDIYQRKV